MRFTVFTLCALTAAAFAPQSVAPTPRGVPLPAAKDATKVPTPSWQVATMNAWTRVMNKQMGKGDFAKSRPRPGADACLGFESGDSARTLANPRRIVSRVADFGRAGARHSTSTRSPRSRWNRFSPPPPHAGVQRIARKVNPMTECVTDDERAAASRSALSLSLSRAYI